MPNDDVELMKLSLQALDDMLMDDSLMPVHFAQLRVIRSHLEKVSTPTTLAKLAEQWDAECATFTRGRVGDPEHEDAVDHPGLKTSE